MKAEITALTPDFEKNMLAISMSLNDRTGSLALNIPFTVPDDQTKSEIEVRAKEAGQAALQAAIDALED